MLTVLLLACSLPFGGGAPQSPAPTAPVAEAPPAPVAVVAPATAPAPPAAPAAPAPGGVAPARIYATLVSHNEEVPNPLCTPVVTDPSAYAENRAQVVAMAEAVVAHHASWNMQNEWQFLQAVKTWDTPELRAKTDGKNLIDWMAQRSPTNIEVDAHTHGKIYNYADVVKMLEELGAPRNGVVGGFIYYPTVSQIWTPLRNEVVGIWALTVSYTASAVGWSRLPWSAEKMACRCGVTFIPWALNSPVSSTGDFTAPTIAHPTTIAN